MIRLTEKDGAVIFTVKVAPCASKSEIAGVLDSTLKVRIAAPPVGNAANSKLIGFLAKTFGVSKSRVEILSGASSKIKQIKISNFSAENFRWIWQAKNERDILPFRSNPKNKKGNLK